MMDQIIISPLYYYTGVIVIKDKIKNWERDILETWYFGNAVGTAFGTYFRYVVGLKASFDEKYMKDMIEGLRSFTLLLLAALRR